MIFRHRPSSPVVDHLEPIAENPDASLFVCGVGNGASVAHALTDRVGFVGSDGVLPAVNDREPLWNSQQNSSADLDHSDGK